MGISISPFHRSAQKVMPKQEFKPMQDRCAVSRG
jgi:hypothetical protein